MGIDCGIEGSEIRLNSSCVRYASVMLYWLRLCTHTRDWLDEYRSADESVPSLSWNTFFFYYIRRGKKIEFTVNVKDVSLDDIFVPLGVAGVVASVDETDVVDVETAIRKDFELIFGLTWWMLVGELTQIQSVTAPHYRRCG